jgi:hypothetical protein
MASEPRQSPGSDYGNASNNAHGSGGSEGWVTTGIAARALGIKSRQCRNLIHKGELEAKLEGEGVEQRYLVSIESLNRLRDQRQSSGRLPGSVPRDRRENWPAASTEADPGQWVLELTARLETRAAEAAELRTRLELTATAESTLREASAREREALERERVALERERERADGLEGAQEEAQRLRTELEAERSKGFWRRLFGG